jgi:hypothetical protein
MKYLLTHLVMLFSLVAFGQKTEKKEEPKPTLTPTGISIGQPFYPMDDVSRLRVRDLEYKANQLEIQIQSMRAEIETSKADEAAIWKEIQNIASQYAKDKAIDGSSYDFDAAETKYIKKKKP